MNASQEIIIPLSKRKLILSLLGAIVFFALGAWFLIAPPEIDNPVIGNVVTLRIIGTACVLFSGVGIVAFTKKLFAKKPGLVIGDKGITDHSSGVSAGFIPWDDIVEINQLEINKQKMLMLIVKDPAIYINRHTGLLKRKMVELNYKNYGSPISISAHALQCNFEELKSMLLKKLSEK